MLFITLLSLYPHHSTSPQTFLHPQPSVLYIRDVWNCFLLSKRAALFLYSEHVLLPYWTCPTIILMLLLKRLFLVIIASS